MTTGISQSAPSPTRPLSIRLALTDIDRLTERARRLSATPTAVARDLIRAGLADGDPHKQAERLLKIERGLAALGQDLQAALQATDANRDALVHIEAMFDQLLRALSGQTIEEEK
ncbi:hypothetical protein [Hoeflea sp.]|uniref:hypothetical protein n=1 Tax=Hoeflea sp. TaxID=1940281 RepID=UPI003B02CEF7